MSAEKQRQHLYREYVDELENMRGLPASERTTSSEIKEWCKDYYENPHYTWIDIYHENQIVGFLIIADKENCHPDCDYFIVQSYVEPKFRKKHLMTNAVHSFVSTHKANYCLVIVNNNKFAYDFWFHLFRDLCYKPKVLCETPNTFDEDVTIYGFEPI
jgi:predicted acetyltransferase